VVVGAGLVAGAGEDGSPLPEPPLLAPELEPPAEPGGALEPLPGVEALPDPVDPVEPVEVVVPLPALLGRPEPELVVVGDAPEVVEPSLPPSPEPPSPEVVGGPPGDEVVDGPPGEELPGEPLVGEKVVGGPPGEEVPGGPLPGEVRIGAPRPPCPGPPGVGPPCGRPPWCSPPRRGSPASPRRPCPRPERSPRAVDTAGLPGRAPPSEVASGAALIKVAAPPVEAFRVAASRARPVVAVAARADAGCAESAMRADAAWEAW
jgi:hypothetical protein